MNYPKILQPGEPSAQRPSYAAARRAHRNLPVPVLLGTLLVAVSKTTSLVMKCNLCCFSWQGAAMLDGFNYSAETWMACAGMPGMCFPTNAMGQLVKQIRPFLSKCRGTNSVWGWCMLLT